MGEIVAGVLLVLLGGLIVRGRAALAEVARQTARDEARYGSLLNAERANRERDANVTEDADREVRLGAVLFGLVLVAGGVLLLVGAALG